MHSSTRNKELVVLSTYREDSINKLEIIQGSDSVIEHANGSTSTGLQFTKLSESNVNLPVTKIQCDPSGNDRFITTNDRLKLWGIDFNNQLIETFNFVNSAQLLNNSSTNQSLAPLTSLDWNKVSTNLIITSSIDTTCTVWDLNHPTTPTTQLIAHDSEVFDVQFIKNSPNMFASCGNDGSMRVFDLRSLEHSTIIYEPSPTASNSNPGSLSSNINTSKQPLLKLATSNVNENVIATFSYRSNEIKILDMRLPAIPVSLLTGHQKDVNSIEWHPTENKLLSGSDDCQAFIWDLSSNNVTNTSTNTTSPITGNNVVDLPAYAYSDLMEVNNVTWNSNGDWFGVVSGKGFQGVVAI